MKKRPAAQSMARMHMSRLRVNSIVALVVVAAGTLQCVSGGVFGQQPSRIAGRSKQHRQHMAVEELRRLVPPPPPSELGGEQADDGMYRRFLSVSEWDPVKAAPRLEKDLAWRGRVKPRLVRPSNCPTLCRQGAWQVLMQPRSALLTWGGSSGEDGAGGESRDDNGPIRGRRQRTALHPPHSCPPMQSWRYTRQGMPITLFECWKWRPHKASEEERVRHIAYHMEHGVRRMPTQKRGVERICVVMDLRGFQSWMLPYVKSAVDVLRSHYPGRAGVMCFINVPGYFRPVWKIISPWLDEEIRGKTFFAPASVDDIERAIAWVDKKNLKVGAV